MSDTTVIFKHGQGHQTENDNVDAKHAYNHAKFERFCFNGVREKANVNCFLFVCLFVSLFFNENYVNCLT